ncbi:hypothetical protein HBJ16_004328 [Pseudomonas sp. CES]|nr:hypothetical protein HBJ16_004328 [Pseudomonas sp. CES]
MRTDPVVAAHQVMTDVSLCLLGCQVTSRWHPLRLTAEEQALHWRMSQQLPAVAVANDQHAHHQLRINRRAPDGAVEIGQMGAQVAEVQALINAAQEVLGRDVLFQIERVKQAR